MSLGLFSKQADNLDDIVGTGKQLWQQGKDTFNTLVTDPARSQAAETGAKVRQEVGDKVNAATGAVTKTKEDFDRTTGAAGSSLINDPQNREDLAAAGVGTGLAGLGYSVGRRHLGKSPLVGRMAAKLPKVSGKAKIPALLAALGLGGYAGVKGRESLSAPSAEDERGSLLDKQMARVQSDRTLSNQAAAKAKQTSQQAKGGVSEGAKSVEKAELADATRKQQQASGRAAVDNVRAEAPTKGEQFKQIAKDTWSGGVDKTLGLLGDAQSKVKPVMEGAASRYGEFMGKNPNLQKYEKPLMGLLAALGVGGAGYLGAKALGVGSKKKKKVKKEAAVKMAAKIGPLLKSVSRGSVSLPMKAKLAAPAAAAKAAPAAEAAAPKSNFGRNAKAVGALGLFGGGAAAGAPDAAAKMIYGDHSNDPAMQPGGTAPAVPGGSKPGLSEREKYQRPGSGPVADLNKQIGDSIKNPLDGYPKTPAAEKGWFDRFGEGSNEAVSSLIPGYGDWAQKTQLGGMNIKQLLPYLLMGGGALGAGSLAKSVLGGDEEEHRHPNNRY